MKELERALIGDSAAAPPERILEGVGADLAARQIKGAPHTIYEELWHVTFWQEMTLDWIGGIETAYPERPADGFPPSAESARESWGALQTRFFESLGRAAAAARDEARMEVVVRCPSRPGQAVRTMTVREQVESLAAHNAYHFGRVVLLRQMMNSWPPLAGGFSW